MHATPTAMVRRVEAAMLPVDRSRSASRTRPELSRTAMAG